MFPSSLFPAGGGGTGGGTVDPSQLALYALKTDLPDVSGFATTTALSNKADQTSLTPLALKTEIPDVSGFVTVNQLPDLSPYALSTQLTPLALKTEIPDVSGFATTTALSNKADQTALATLALKSELPDLTNYMNNVDMANWFETYINTNPNSWIVLRNNLEYFPPTYTVNLTTPTVEYVARPDRLINLQGNGGYTGLLDTNGTNATYTPNTSQTIHQHPSTSTAPYGIRKPMNVQWGLPSTVRWTIKGTFFIVYSRTANPTPPTIVTNYFGTGSGFKNWWTRSNLTLNLQTLDQIDQTDPDIGKPYIMGMSWDYTLNPPRVIWLTHTQAITHKGPNEPTELYNLNDPSGLTFTAATSMNFPYNVDQAAGSTRLCSLLCGYASTHDDEEAVLHYFGYWDTGCFTMDQMRTIHYRLLVKYCTEPFDGTNKTLME